MSGLQRYLRCARSGDMRPDSKGAWCKYDDVVAEIERLREILEDACRWHEQFPIQRVREALRDAAVRQSNDSLT